MQEHTVVAIAKMGRNNSDLRKFIFEDGRVVLVEQRFPVATTPRIDSLINFLQDLGYLDSKNNLTNIAETPHLSAFSLTDTYISVSSFLCWYRYEKGDTPPIRDTLSS